MTDTHLELTAKVNGNEYILTQRSESPLVVPLAVEYAKKFGGVLQSAAEASALLAADDDTFKRDWGKRIATRTVALYYAGRNEWRVGFYDLPGNDNLTLTNAYEGFVYHERLGSCWYQRDDSILRCIKQVSDANAVLTQARWNEEVDNRNVHEGRHIANWVVGDVGHALVDALAQHGIRSTRLKLLSHESLSKKVSDSTVEARPVFLEMRRAFGSESPFEKMFIIRADLPYSTAGYARATLQSPDVVNGVCRTVEVAERGN